MDNRDPIATPGSNRLLNRLGGWYPILVQAGTQLIFDLVTFFLVAMPTQQNAELSTAQVLGIIRVVVPAAGIRYVILLALMALLNRPMLERLNRWKNGLPAESERQEVMAWKMATGFAWQYAPIAFFSMLVMVLPPVVLYMHNTLQTTNEQIVYLALPTFAAGGGLIGIVAITIERLMRPVRQVLLPQKFELQAAGGRGLSLLPKIILAIIAMVVLSTLLLAPIGYHQINVALYQNVNSQQILNQTIMQLWIASGGGIILGLILAYTMTRSFSDPIRDMVATFGKVEEGDLNQRVKIIATDEIGELAIYFNRMIARVADLRTSLEKQVAAQAEQLRAILDVNRAATGTLDANELVDQAAKLIADRFGYYYAAVFLVDASEHWAELKHATGAAGRILLQNKHRLEVGGKSMVGVAIETRKLRIALDVGENAIRFDNPLLPETRSEIALPIIAGEHVLGALDVQSNQENAFSPQEVEILQGIANQVAIGIENARLFQEAQRNLREMDMVYRQYLSTRWMEVSAQGGLEYSVGASESEETGRSVLNIPLALREQNIGQITLESDIDLTAEERNLVEAVAVQAAVALENARLLDESRQFAVQERALAEITSKIWSSTTVDGILQTAIKELGRTLNVSEGTIELKAE